MMILIICTCLRVIHAFFITVCSLQYTWYTNENHQTLTEWMGDFWRKLSYLHFEKFNRNVKLYGKWGEIYPHLCICVIKMSMKDLKEIKYKVCIMEILL